MSADEPQIIELVSIPAVCAGWTPPNSAECDADLQGLAAP